MRPVALLRTPAQPKPSLGVSPYSGIRVPTVHSQVFAFNATFAVARQPAVYAHYLTAQSYAAEGFALVRELISPDEALALQFECVRALQASAGQPDRLGSISPMIQNLGRDRRLVELATELLDEPALLMTEGLATAAGIAAPQQMAVPPESILTIAVAVAHPPGPGHPALLRRTPRTPRPRRRRHLLRRHASRDLRNRAEAAPLHLQRRPLRLSLSGPRHA